MSAWSGGGLGVALRQHPRRMEGDSRPQRKRALRAVLALGVLFLAGLGCTRVSDQPVRAPQTSAPPVPGTATGAPVTITVLSAGGGRQGLPWQNEWIAAFQEQHPDYRVQVVELGPDLAEWPEIARQKIQDGTVDLVPTEFLGDLGALVRDGLLLPLDPYIQESRLDLARYALVDQMRLDGRLYDLPWGVQTWVLVYNKDLFAAAGVPEPREGWTWDEFRAAAAQLTRSDGERRTWGFWHPAGFRAVLLRVEQMTGRPAYEADPETFLEALTFFQTMAATDGSVPPAEVESRHSLLQSRQVAMGAEIASALPHLGLTYAWDIAPWPTVPGAPEQVGGADVRAMGIAATSRDPQAAWEFLRFVAGEAGAVITAHHGILPAYRSPAVEDAYLNANPSLPPGARRLLRGEWRILPRDRNSAASEVVRAQIQAAQAVMMGEKPLAEAYQEYLQTLAGIRDRAGLP